MSNRLSKETSPYLLQHAENPVNWYSWCEEAFEDAKKQDKPVFLSIGYSTCHWCHVMAHESFEDERVAQLLNKYFISIKVDREERPDIDSVYMSFCQAFTGSGGWPMSIFMSWDKKPFFAGTYFPPQSRYGMPSFSDIVKAIAAEWCTNRSRLLKSSEKIIKHLKQASYVQSSQKDEHLIEKAVQFFSDTFDSSNGGFGSAPKFPTPHNLLFLMLFSKTSNDKNALEMAEKTLIQMRKGGIFDHIGYGFSRYSTDEKFLVPHFEKMLYDNALLIVAYSAAYSLTNNSVYLDTAKKTAEYILREMTSNDGGFYSAQDADSEGVEGKYYLFSQKETSDLLGQMAKSFNMCFDISEKGNFEGKNIPNLLKNDEIPTGFEEELKKLYDFRKNRVLLSLDDKILVSWNSMTIAAFCMLYRVSKKEKYLNAAKKAQSFIEKNMCQSLQLYTSFREKRSTVKGFLEDYAFYICAL
ncbi:MAG: thioredoxin domain-containing protein, partial [Ruminococcaceae bacterium]|nr:thioredoxin domain-containing protein [Oscillospiraceae bacterium]